MQPELRAHQQMSIRKPSLNNLSSPDPDAVEVSGELGERQPAVTPLPRDSIVALVAGWREFDPLYPHPTATT